MFRIEFVSVINLHTKFNMTGRHVPLLKEYYKTKTISIFQAIAILFQSTEKKVEEDEEEEEEKEVASMEENYPYKTPKPVNKKNPRLSTYGISNVRITWDLTAIVQKEIRYQHLVKLRWFDALYKNVLLTKEAV